VTDVSVLVLVALIAVGVVFSVHGFYRVRHPVDWRERAWWGRHFLARLLIANDHRPWAARRRGRRTVEHAGAAAEMTFGAVVGLVCLFDLVSRL
jgi:hypothetical protein